MPESSDILIADMSLATPREAYTADDATVFNPISPRPTGGWRVIEYESTSYTGRFLQSHDPQAAVLTIPLDLHGWHALSIGLAPMAVKSPQVCAIEVRLTGTSRWQLLKAEGWEGVREEPWLMADLTGKSLQVRYPRSIVKTGSTVTFNGVKLGPPAVARLFSIRATPMAEADVKAVRGAVPRDGLYGTDGHGVLVANRPDRHGIKRFFRAFAGGDWNLCFYGGGAADVGFYHTRVGELYGAEGTWDADATQLAIARTLRQMIAIGQDPLAIAVDQAHRQKHPIFIYMRNALWNCEPPLDQVMRSSFYAQHPEFCMREADGTVVGSYLSIAFDEVQARMNAMLEEYLTMGPTALRSAL